MTKIAILVPYFGKTPNYFDLFLESCSRNDKIDFLIITDNKDIQPRKNSNIKIINTTLKIIEEKAKQRIYKKCKLSTPYKLCDYRPAYGLIFQELIDKYDYWGFCDCDIIFGDLTPIINEANKKIYEKILSQGHLQLIRNNKNNNNLFKQKVNFAINYKTAFRINSPCFFDEISFNLICKKTHLKQYINKGIYADILPQFNDFRLPNNNIEGQYFYYKNGKIIRLPDNKEYIYIHLQKRNMLVDGDIGSIYYIKPNIISRSQNMRQNDSRQRKNYYKSKIIKIIKNPLIIAIKPIVIISKHLIK